MKYCRYGFSAICSTSSLSEYWNFVWMMSAPRAMRRGFATFPVPLGNKPAYLVSNSSHGMLSAIFTHRLSGFICSPMGWLKSRKECWVLSVGLYMAFCSIPR